MKKFLYGTMALLGLGLTACSSDDLNPGQVADNDEIRYVRVAISNPPSTTTRVDNDETNFEAGTAEENTVNNIVFKFFDINGDPVATVTPTNLEFKDATPAQGSPSVGKITEVIVPLSLEKGKNYPTYVICFINPVNFDDVSVDAKYTMEDLRTLLRYDYKTTNGFFAMSNSVYYGPNPITGASMVKRSGAAILQNQLYNTKEEAEDDEATPVEIYVERYAAKVQFTLNPDNIKTTTLGLDDDSDYVLTFEPEAWTINADEPTTYAIKRFDDSNADTNVIATYDQVNEMLGNWKTWNDPTLCRSYWGNSPSYYSNTFPQVSDDIIDKAVAITNGTGLIDAQPGSMFGAGVIVKNSGYDLRYYSYNQIVDPDLKSEGVGETKFIADVDPEDNTKTILPYKYALENTMGKSSFASLNPNACSPSVVLVGHYNITAAGTAVTAPDGFCEFNGKLYFKNLATTTGAPTGAMSIKDALLIKNELLTNAAGTPIGVGSPDAIKDLFEVVHPSASVRGTLSVPHRYVTLQLKSTVTQAQLEGLYYKPAGYQNPVHVTVDEGQTLAEMIDNINLLLWQNVGNAEAYTQNKAYFSIPIQHLGITENTLDPSPIAANGSIDWTKARRGDFGLVRNHVYTLQVSEINGRASGIENLSNPLVPAMSVDQYWVKYQLKILNWRIVPTQGNIILK